MLLVILHLEIWIPPEIIFLVVDQEVFSPQAKLNFTCSIIRTQSCWKQNNKGVTKHILVLEKEVEGLARSLFRVPGEDDAVTQLDMVPPPADTWWGQDGLSPHGRGCFPRTGNSFSAQILPVSGNKRFSNLSSLQWERLQWASHASGFRSLNCSQSNVSSIWLSNQKFWILILRILELF